MTMLSHIRMILICCFVLVGCVNNQTQIQTEVVGPKIEKQPVPKIILDTDFGGDADDLGAIAILHQFADQEKVEILSIISWSNELHAIPAIDAVNRFYGRPGLPIAVRNVPKWETSWNYSKVIADHFPNKVTETFEVDSAVDLYRQQLAFAQDHSITIVTIRPLANIQNLLRSEPDKHSDLSGAELFDLKVKEMVVMGGRFSETPSEDWPEWNFDGNMPGVTHFVLSEVQRPIVFSGYEVGAALKIGHELNAHPKDTPLYKGYKYFSEHAPWMKEKYENEILDNASFDQTAIIYAAIGASSDYWRLSKPGKASADDKGYNIWSQDPNGTHKFLILNANTEKLEQIILEGMTHRLSPAD